MKRVIFVLTVMFSCFTLISGMNSVFSGQEEAKKCEPTPGSQKCEKYRTAIQEKYGLNIHDFKDIVTGRRANGKKIHDYDLE